MVSSLFPPNLSISLKVLLGKTFSDTPLSFIPPHSFPGSDSLLFHNTNSLSVLPPAAGYGVSPKMPKFLLDNDWTHEVTSFKVLSIEGVNE